MGHLKKQEDLCIFFVITEREIDDGEFESCIFKYLDNIPSRNIMSDFYVFINKLTSRSKVEKIGKLVEANRFVRSITFINLDLSQELDCFWYPWSFSQKIKPKDKPELGYTSGANILFYIAIEAMFETNYKNFLMLECDTKPLRRNWFDVVYRYCENNTFDIAGSTYKGIAEWHSDSEYKEHINGVAIYANSASNKSLIKASKKIVARECKEVDYLNFDVANLIAREESKRKKPFILKDTDFIVNISDPVDQHQTEEEIIEKYPRATIVHQKQKKISPILDISVFEKNYNDSLPVFFCMPKCASEYVLGANIELLKVSAKKDRKKPLVLKLHTKSNSRLIFYCKCDLDFFLLPRSLFKDVSGISYTTDIKTFNDLVINNYIDIFSMAIDFRNSPADIDEAAFYLLKAIFERIKKSPEIYTFLRHPFEVLKSSFPTWENVNFRGIDPDAQERRRRFNVFSTLYPNMFMQKRLLGASYDGSMEQKNHLYAILENFYIYDVSAIEDVLSSLFKHFCGVSMPEIEPIKDINPTKNVYNIDLGVFMKAKVAQNVWGLKSQEDIQIYKEFAIQRFDSNIGEIMKKNAEFSFMQSNIPVFFHIPKNAGTFIIATMNKFFVRVLKVAPEDMNFQRLSIRTQSGHEIKAFVYFTDENWKSDTNIKVFPSHGPKVRARQTDLKTLERYLSLKQVKLLTMIIEPAGEILDLRNSFYETWNVLESCNKTPVNFCIVRNSYDRASSIYNYLKSDESMHEKTHGAFDHLKTFPDYIKSDMLEDSWTIRAVTGAPINMPLNEKWKDQALSFFEKHKFIVRDIKESQSLLQQVLAYCFEETLSDLDTKNINANKSQYKTKKIKFAELSMDERDTFNNRSKWDIDFYQEILEKKC